MAEEKFKFPVDWEEWAKTLDSDAKYQIKGVMWGNKLIVELINPKKTCLVNLSCNDQAAIEIVRHLIDSKPNIREEIKNYLG